MHNDGDASFPYTPAVPGADPLQAAVDAASGLLAAGEAPQLLVLPRRQGMLGDVRRALRRSGILADYGIGAGTVWVRCYPDGTPAA